MGIEEAILQEFKEKGLEEGRKEGREEKMRNVVFRAWKRNMPVGEIADLVEVSVDKVEAIIREFTDDVG
ncbi:MAG: hypothetical protein H6558_13860 [Lewinellaceae bacterium]|nr:hypothetical protein [Lewinellaceae bacterium]